MVQGITEKLILQDATIVLVPPGACTHARTPITSSYTREVCRGRAQRSCEGKRRGLGQRSGSGSVNFVMGMGEALKSVKRCEIPPACIRWDVP